MQLLDVAGPLQVLSSVNDLLAERGAPPAYRAAAVSASGGEVSSSAGLGLVTARLPRGSRPVDTLVVAGGFGVHAAARDATLVRWIARRAASARRTASVCTGAFARAFAAETGTTPAKAVERVRVDAARAALEGGAPVKRVARDCGFGSAETLRRAFLRRVGTGPDEYRRRFVGP